MPCYSFSPLIYEKQMIIKLKQEEGPIIKMQNLQKIFSCKLLITKVASIILIWISCAYDRQNTVPAYLDCMLRLRLVGWLS